MRNAVLLLIGLVVGAIGATSVVNALAQRDAYARGVMQVMQHHYGMLRAQLRSGRCASPVHGKAMLEALTEEIEPAIFGDDTPDAPFHDYVQRLREAVVQLPDNATACTALAPAVERIGSACDRCHQQYR